MAIKKRARASTAAVGGKSGVSAKRGKRELDGSIALESPDSDDEKGGCFEGDTDEGDSEEEETPDEKRIRLAKQYLSELGGSTTDEKRTLLEEREEAEEIATGKRVDWGVGSRTTFFRAVEGNSENVTFKKGHRDAVTAVCLQGPAHQSIQNPTTLFTAGKDCAILQWDLNTLQKTVYSGKRKDFYCGGHFEAVRSLAWCEELNLLVSVGADSLLRLWDPRVSTEKCIDSLRGHQKGITKIVMDIPESNANKISGSMNMTSGGGASTQCYTVGSDKQVKLWDLKHRSELNMYLGHTDQVNDMDIITKGRVVTGSIDKSCRYWKTETDTHLVFGGTTTEKGTIGHHSSVDAVCALQTDKFISGGQDGSLYCWSADKGAPIASYENAHSGHASSSTAPNQFNARNSRSEGWISALGCTKHSDYFVSGSSDGYVRSWKLARIEKEGKPGAAPSKKQAFTYSIQPLESIPVPGVVNAITESKDHLFCGVGQSHRLGRWEYHRDAKNGLAIIKKWDSSREDSE